MGPKRHRYLTELMERKGSADVDGLPGNPGDAGERRPPCFARDTGLFGEPGNVYAQLSLICQVMLGFFRVLWII